MKESAGPTIENIPQENLKELSLRLISKIEKYCEQIHGFENLGLFFKDGVESLLENIQRAKKNVADGQDSVIYFDDNFIEIKNLEEIAGIEIKIAECLNKLNDIDENQMTEDGLNLIDKFINSNKNFDILDDYNPSCLIISKKEGKAEIEKELLKGKLAENEQSIQESNIEEILTEDGYVDEKK